MAAPITFYALEKEKRREVWQSRWSGEVWKKWHLTKKDPCLWKYLHLLCTDENDKSGIFLVPMCGKNLDMKLLYEAGFNVVGVEICEPAIQDFFKESDLSYEVDCYSDEFKIYRTPDSRLKVLCGDLLSLEKDVLGGVPVRFIWDKAAIGSIEKEIKKKYAQVMKSLIKGSQVKCLLQCWEHREWYRSSSPHNCPVEMIHDLYGDVFDIKELEGNVKRDVIEMLGLLEPARQVTYLMSSK